MTYKVKLTSKAANDFKKLDNSIRHFILKAFDKLSANPDIGKPLEQSLRNLFSYRASSYRIVYKIYRKEIHILVVAIGHRREVYDKLRKLLR